MSGLPFTVRRLAAWDAPLVHKLNAMFGAAFAEPEMDRAKLPDEAYLALALYEKLGGCQEVLHFDIPVAPLPADSELASGGRKNQARD